MSAMPRTVLQNEESSGTPHDLYYKYFTHRHKVFCSSQHPTVAMELLCKEIENQLFFFFPEVYPELLSISENHVDNCDAAFGIRVIDAIVLYWFVAVALMGILDEGTCLCRLHFVFQCRSCVGIYIFKYTVVYYGLLSFPLDVAERLLIFLNLCV